ncbi:hypothetical protein [Aquitalea sp. LB_tupeE]|uniref:hypothetical protein n=1 Tax=Aquitalea sp. LB_tupeE TaxID=2748078 RepID=UPI0015C03B6B|nr:hypothetical protein [Aquitalea sp. LB_tupeE]
MAKRDSCPSAASMSTAVNVSIFPLLWKYKTGSSNINNILAAAMLLVTCSGLLA